VATLHEDQYTFFIVSRSVLLRMRNVSDKRCREKNHILCYKAFFPKIARENVEKYSRAGHTTGDNMAHTHCMLDT